MPLWSFTFPWLVFDPRFTPASDAGAMIDPYDPPHPDGPDDPEDYPLPLAQVSWLNDEELDDVDWRDDFRLVMEER
jgi:hypothetical protein